MDPDNTIPTQSSSGMQTATSEMLRSMPDPLETASQRLFLYLKALHIPVHQRYDLVEEALNRAAALHISDGDIVASSMRCLREILRSDPKYQHVADPQTCFFTKDKSFVSMPRMNRTSMIPVPLERTGPLKFFFLLFIRLLLGPLRPPLRKVTLVIILIALVVLYLWQQFGQ